jgi:hypothetical protein
MFALSPVSGKRKAAITQQRTSGKPNTPRLVTREAA